MEETKIIYLFKLAYKKLKSSVYYDKTLSRLKNDLVFFEHNVKKENLTIDKYLSNLANDFLNENGRKKILRNALNSIDCMAFPKDFKESDNKNDNLILNFPNDDLAVEQCQYFISMSIEGHILGILWIILIGKFVDESLSTHIYGNRLKNNKNSDELLAFSPSLFEIYFKKYENWRDKALDLAQRLLDKNKDVLILTLDFKRFFYSIHVTRNLIDTLLNEVKTDSQKVLKNYVCESYIEDILKFLNDFVLKVIEKYSKLYYSIDKANKYSKKAFLPIGFFPSNILSNYVLKNFDRAILDGWNPVYYGRYVDDIIIVEKIEQGCSIHIDSEKHELNFDAILKFFMMQLSRWEGFSKVDKNVRKSLIIKNKNNEEYYLNQIFNPLKSKKMKFTFNKDKIKAFYFKAGETDALITCFREKISRNKSEFRHLPEDEYMFRKDEFGEVYNLHNNESLNKFRCVNGVEINRLELSKLVGRYLSIGALIDDKNKIQIFESKLQKIFNSKVLLQSYLEWEKILEFSVIAESWIFLEQMVKHIIKAISSVNVADKLVSTVKRSLFKHFEYSLLRVLPLCWGNDINRFIKNYIDIIKDLDPGYQLVNEENEITEWRKFYIYARMIDKNVMPVLIDMIDLEKIEKEQGGYSNINFSRFNHIQMFFKVKFENDYVYYPYYVTMQDFSLISFVEMIITKTNNCKDENLNDNNSKKDNLCCSGLDKIFSTQKKRYLFCNYGRSNLNDNLSKNICVQFCKKLGVFELTENDSFKVYEITIGNSHKGKLRIAIANLKLNFKDIELILKDKANRTYNKLITIIQLVNASFDEKVDMLILPELAVPFDYLSILARYSVKNNIAIITGVEFVKYNNFVFNYSAAILPYVESNCKNSFISFHLKNHYAPNEKKMINGYSLKEREGDHYEIYRWNDCYFSLYCCYELTSIAERSLFHSLLDFLVAIEWNKDVNYFSNIIESLSRDIHCYCVQVNSSDYGDSRIVKPSKTEEKNIIKTKGGINSTVLVGEIDIEKLRQFQLKDYILQNDDQSFKPTPPGFNRVYLKKRIDGESYGLSQ